jgi:hypothetical protein
MPKFEYDLSIQAGTQAEADQKMKALVTILNKLSKEELVKVAEVVSNPVQLALIKTKLL